MKIVYCTDTICYTGGIQTVTICKANALAQIPSNEIWIIVTDNKGHRVAPVNDSVHIIDLDINYYEDDWKSKYHLIKGMIVKRKAHKKKLQEVLNQIEPDIVIATGTSEKYFLPTLKIKSNPVFIREFHFQKGVRLAGAKGLFDRLSAHWGNLIDYHHYIFNYDKVAVLTKEDKEKHWHNKPFITVIPNPITFDHATQLSDLNNKTVITIGRLVDQKNYASLIQAWKSVNQRHPDWKLNIWGNGAQQNYLQTLVDKFKLTNSVKLKGYSYHINEEIAKASIYVLSSKYEGLPLVILEAMACGLPVVSYTCPCGPRDIITEGKDGLLVPLNDEKTLAEKICYLIEHEDIRKKMGKAALEKSKNYSIDKIIAQWMNLFNELLAEKRK